MDQPFTTHATTQNGRHRPEDPHDHELEELADLFLGPADHPGNEAGEHHAAAQPRDHLPRHHTRLEAVILGHLPISASAWPGQYARRRAEQTGAPVAVVRLAGGSLTIDLIGAGNPEHPPATDTDALAIARRVAHVVILRVDDPTEARLAALPALDSLCVLTGADDAAVVACYRKLKALAATATDRLPPVHLTVMGADYDRGRQAHERVARAAREFLDADLLDPVVIDRIGPTGSTAVFRGPTGLPIEEIGRLLTEAPAEPPRSASTPQPPQEMPTAQTPTPTVEPAQRAPSRDHEVTAPAPSACQERLSDLVTGLAPIETRCAAAPQVELAVDGRGRLHLLAARLAGLPDRSSLDPTGELIRVAGWARANAALLMRAEPAVRGVDPVLHLITDDARAAAALAGSLVRVHLAVPARPMAFGLAAVAFDQ